MSKVAILTVIFIGFSCGPSVAEEARKAPRNPLTEEDRLFAEEFSALLRKHPKAAKRFVIADFGMPQSIEAWTPSVYECDRYEDSIGFGGTWVECHAEHPE